MSARIHAKRRGFEYVDTQPDWGADLVRWAGIFRVRVRIPHGDGGTPPGLWVGFAAGGPLVERKSEMQYSDVLRMIDDAATLARVLRGY